MDISYHTIEAPIISRGWPGRQGASMASKGGGFSATRVPGSVSGTYGYTSPPSSSYGHTSYGGGSGYTNPSYCSYDIPSGSHNYGSQGHIHHNQGYGHHNSGGSGGNYSNYHSSSGSDWNLPISPTVFSLLLTLFLFGLFALIFYYIRSVINRSKPGLRIEPSETPEISYPV